MICLAQAADIFATGVVAGSFAIGSFAMHPAAAELGDVAQIRFRQALIRRLARFLPPFMLAPLLAVPLALASCDGSQNSVSAMGFLLSLATVVTTVGINAPLNRRFARWSVEKLPVDWPRDIARWNAAHSVRMVTGVGAFICAILAAQ